jgi:hypothetical protein
MHHCNVSWLDAATLSYSNWCPAENGDASGSRFIVATAFSPCGQRLVVVTGDNRHTVSVFAWRPKQLLHQGVGHNGQPPQVG